jgi:hypothetical protein
MGISNPDTIRGIAQLARIGKTTLSAPAVDRTAIQDEVWENSEDAIRKAVRAGKDHCRVRKSISAVFVEAAWDADLSKSRSAIASLAASPFRFFSPRFRQAVAEIAGYLKTSDQTLTAKKSLLASVFPKLPMPAEQCLAYLDSMAKSHVDNQTVDQLSDLAKRSFGTRWLGLESDWDSLTETCDWVAKCKELGSSQASRRALANVDNSQELIARIKQVATHLKPLRDELGQLVKLLQFDASVLGNKDILSVPAAALRTRLLDWQENLDELSSWSRYLACHLQAQQNGLVAVANSLFDGCLAENLPAQFEVGFYEAQLRKTYELLPNLARFSGESHQRTMERFRELDLERLGLARQEAALAHYERLPRHDNASGELGVLKHEMKKKRAHMPIRKLLSSAGHAVQHLKPVFMMSPLSVAQYLEPGVLEFDVLLIDEASQVRPVDALGAISRCKQIIVVGDERQMPPTNFFGKMLGGDDGEEDDNQNARDLESVLGLCISRNMPQRMLRCTTGANTTL